MEEAQVLQALAAALGDNTDPQQRVMATQFLDTLQQNLELSYKLGVKFYCPQDGSLQLGGLQPTAVQRFGAQLLAKAVGTHWARLTEPQKQEMKVLVLKMAESLQDVTAEARFLRSAVVDLAVEVAIREWPQRWPDLLDHLTVLVERGVRGLPSCSRFEAACSRAAAPGQQC